MEKNSKFKSVYYLVKSSVRAMSLPCPGLSVVTSLNGVRVSSNRGLSVFWNIGKALPVPDLGLSMTNNGLLVSSLVYFESFRWDSMQFSRRLLRERWNCRTERNDFDVVFLFFRYDAL